MIVTYTLHMYPSQRAYKSDEIFEKKTAVSQEVKLSPISGLARL